MNNISLDTIYNIIDLCKYAEVNGEKAELIISPYNNARKIRIGIKNGLSRDYYEYDYDNGVEFDLKVLPLIVERFLEKDKIRSWVSQDPKMDNYPSKELIVTEKENECLIQTFDRNFHSHFKDIVETLSNVQDTQETFTKEELACEKILKYLRIKHKKREEFDNLPENLRNELIQIIDKAYFINKGKTLTDEQIYNFAQNISDGISKDAFNTIANDIRNENSTLINQIRDYIKNEKFYENYLDEEPYMSLARVGDELVKNGYFDNRYAFPQKTDLDNLTDEKLKEIVSSEYKSKYKFLAEQKEEYEKSENTEYAEITEHFMNYLVKTARGKIHRNKPKEEFKFKETVQEYSKDDIKTLVNALRLYKGGKLDSEKLEIIIEEEEASYKINIRLSSGSSRDSNLFKFTKNDAFQREILPIIIQDFMMDDSILEQKKEGNSTLIKTSKNNELLIKSRAIDNLTIDNNDYSKFKALTNKDESEITPYDEKVKEELAEKNEDIKKVFNAERDFVAGAITKSELDKSVNEMEIPIIKKEAPKVENKVVIGEGIIEKKGFLKGESKYLASYFRKEILRDKGLLPPNGYKEIQKLVSLSEDVRTLEDAKQNMNDGKLSKEKYTELHDYYRKLLAEDIKKSKDNKEEVAPSSKKTIVEQLRQKVKQRKPDKFDYLHKLVKDYNVKNVNGELKVFNRSVNSELLFRNKDQLAAVEFANFWNSALGIKASKDEITLGEKYAFSENSRKLFNIINSNLYGDYLQLDNIKEEFQRSGIENQDLIFNRLFKDNEYVKYVTYGLKTFNSTYVEKKLDIVEENRDVKAINDAYEIAEAYADGNNTASLKIHFPSEEPNKVQVYVTQGIEKNEKITFERSYDKDYFMKDILKDITENFIDISNILKVHEFNAPGTDKCGFIAVGSKDSIIQMTNASMRDAHTMSTIIKNKFEKNKNIENSKRL